MANFRCINEDCADHPGGLQLFDFWADEPKCPKCGREGEAEKIYQIATIHYDPPHSKLKGHGTNFIACNPKRHVSNLGQHHCATGVPEVVTCPKCQETDVWQANKPHPYGDDIPERKISVQGRGIDLQDQFDKELKTYIKSGKHPNFDPKIFEDGCC